MMLYLDRFQDVPGVDGWRTNLWLGVPAVFHNSTGTAITNGLQVIDPGIVGFYPG